MKGHVIAERESKEGWVFVPDAHLRFNLIVLEEEAVIHSMRTYPGEKQIIWPDDSMEYKIHQSCDFVTELEVPSDILRWAQYSIERNDRWNENLRKANKKMEADGHTEDFPSSEVLATYYGEVDKEPSHPPELKLDAAVRLAIYRQIQGWILGAGGLI
jgi:hypothetical protein